MSADAMARLRQALEFLRHGGLGTDVRAGDLRALLDAHTALEAAHREVTDLTGDLTPEALTRLSDVQGYVRCGDRAVLSTDYERGIAEGERRERARVVAWLREADDETWVGDAADAIARGEHTKEGA